MKTNMANSLLPSHDASVLTPRTVGHWLFTITPFEALETYGLSANGSLLTMHPNGSSLKELVTRIADYRAGKVEFLRVEQQWNSILACGGLAKSGAALRHYCTHQGEKTP